MWQRGGRRRRFRFVMIFNASSINSEKINEFQLHTLRRLSVTVIVIVSRK